MPSARDISTCGHRFLEHITDQAAESLEGGYFTYVMGLLIPLTSVVVIVKSFYEYSVALICLCAKRTSRLCYIIRMW